MYKRAKYAQGLVIRRRYEPKFAGRALYLWNALRRIQEGRARYRDWKLVLEMGTFPIHYLFLPEAWKRPLPKEGLRLLKAWGLGGALVRTLNSRMAKAERIGIKAGDGPHPRVGHVLQFLVGLIMEFPIAIDEQKEMVDEALLFARNGYCLWDCPRGHLYIAPPQRRVVCDAHKWAELQKRRRLREKQGIPPRKKRSSGVKREGKRR